MSKNKNKNAADAPAAEFGGNNTVLSNIVAPIGLLLILLATTAPFFFKFETWAQTAYPFVYLAGAVVLLAARLFNRRHTTDMRLQGLYRMETWSPILFMAAIAMRFLNTNDLRDWIAFTMAGAVLQVFTSLAIPAREKKLKNQQAQQQAEQNQ